MPSRREQEQVTRPPTKQGDGDSGTRSGHPNYEEVPSHPGEHKSGYGGERGPPRTGTDQREISKRS